MLCNNQLRNIFWSNLSYQAVKSVSNGVSFHLHRHWHQNCKIVIQDLNLDKADPNHDLTRAHSNYSRYCNSDDSNNCHLFGSLDLATLNWPLVEFDKVQLDLVVVWNDCQVPKYHNKIPKIFCLHIYPWHIETWRLTDRTGTDWSKSCSAWCPSTIATMTNWCLVWLISFPISDRTYRTQWTTIIWTSWIIGAIIECSRRQIWVTLIKC